MSARQSPVERDARQFAADTLRSARGRRASGDGGWQVIEDAVRVCERCTAYAMQRGDIPGARRWARAAQLLDEAQKRLNDRQARDNARVLAQAGVVPNARVVVVGAGYSSSAPAVGTVMTLGDETATTYFLRGTDDDGRVWLVNFRDVEVVPDAPIPDSRIESGQYMTVEEIKSAAASGAFDDGAGHDDSDERRYACPTCGAYDTQVCSTVTGRSHIARDRGDASVRA